ncbi:MAG: FAD-dependent oxidoreductase [Candidatus Saccharimonadales bacterium]
MLKYIDKFIDHITMYHLLLYYLLVLLVAATIFSAVGILGYNPLGIVIAAVYLVIICLVANKIFAHVFHAPVNQLSAYLTALILALIITPLAKPQGLEFLTAAAVIAMASKYILAIDKKHVFNPAAIAVVITSFAVGQSASWWVGTVPLLPFVIVGGVLLARKLRRIQMVAIFLVVAVIMTMLISLLKGNGVLASLPMILDHSSLFFLGFVMLSEPLTTPPTRRGQSLYALLAGLIFSPQIHIFSLYSTPELTLVVSNVFSYIISPKRKLVLPLKQKNQLTPDITEFVFQPEQRLKYRAGQYMEITLPHQHVDFRGTRRTFTLASSPTEDEVRFGLKFYPKGSSFKKAISMVTKTTPLAIGQLAGDFTLPKNPEAKLAFIAGGIGVTPYRSLVKYLLDSDDKREMTLMYSERSASELVYRDVFDAAAKLPGKKIVYSVDEAPQDWRGQRGRITADMIKAEIPDYRQRLFYVSGPLPMVNATKQNLRALGVPRRRVITDYFPGYA